MNDEFSGYAEEITLGDDGVYRWYYDMNMYRNKSMLFTLEKVNLFTFLGVSVGGALLTGFMAHDFRASIVRGILLIGLSLGALMAVLYVLGFYIAARVKKGSYRLHFAMDEKGIELIWSDRLKEGVDVGRKTMAVVGSVIGSRIVRGRLRPSLEEVSCIAFSTVTSYKRYSKWNMLDLSVPGGKFQVYAAEGELGFLEDFIRAHIPQRARR